MAPFYGWGSTASRLQLQGGSSRRQFTFYHSVPRNFWYSFYRPRKDERLSRPWSHPVVLNMGLLDWESSALTTRPLLLNLEENPFHFTKVSENTISDFLNELKTN